MAKVSIIVPVYNAGDKLELCLNSLVSQSLKDIEIILVIDCPTDGSDKTAEKYAASDNRIRLVKNERNLNISLSRNKGIELASGKYIAFADHDDFCDINMYKKLYEAAEAANADAAICNFQETDIEEFTEYDFKVKGDIIHPESFVSDIISGQSQPIWTHLYAKAAIGDIRFIDGASFEDGLFNTMFYLNNPKVVYVHEALYHHFVHKRNEFKSYKYRNYEMTSTYLHHTIAAIENSGQAVVYEKALAKGVFKRSYSCFINEQKHKGNIAAFNMIFRIKHDKELRHYIVLHKKYKDASAEYSFLKKFILLLWWI